VARTACGGGNHGIGGRGGLQRRGGRVSGRSCGLEEREGRSESGSAGEHAAALAGGDGRENAARLICIQHT
jgi:hypothetical protein